MRVYVDLDPIFVALLDVLVVHLSKSRNDVVAAALRCLAIRHRRVSDDSMPYKLPESHDLLRGLRDSNAMAETAEIDVESITSDVGLPDAPSPTGAKRSDSRHFAPGSRPFEQRVAEIEAAIASVTRSLGRVPDEAVPMLVAERAAMRAELRALREPKVGSVVVLERRR